MKRQSTAKAPTKKTQDDSFPRPFSSIVVDGIERAPSRGMLYATGFKKDDFQKPQIGVGAE